MSYGQRYFIASCCCLDQFFRKKKLLHKGSLDVYETFDPAIIIWENLGVSLAKKCGYWLSVTGTITLQLMVSYWVQIYFQ